MGAQPQLVSHGREAGQHFGLPVGLRPGQAVRFRRNKDFGLLLREKERVFALLSAGVGQYGRPQHLLCRHYSGNWHKKLCTE